MKYIKELKLNEFFIDYNDLIKIEVKTLIGYKELVKKISKDESFKFIDLFLNNKIELKNNFILEVIFNALNYEDIEYNKKILNLIKNSDDIIYYISYERLDVFFNILKKIFKNFNDFKENKDVIDSIILFSKNKFTESMKKELFNMIFNQILILNKDSNPLKEKYFEFEKLEKYLPITYELFPNIDNVFSKIIKNKDDLNKYSSALFSLSLTFFGRYYYFSEESDFRELMNFINAIKNLLNKFLTRQETIETIFINMIPLFNYIRFINKIEFVFSKEIIDEFLEGYRIKTFEDYLLNFNNDPNQKYIFTYIKDYLNNQRWTELEEKLNDPKIGNIAIKASIMMDYREKFNIKERNPNLEYMFLKSNYRFDKGKWFEFKSIKKIYDYLKSVNQEIPELEKFLAEKDHDVYEKYIKNIKSKLNI